MSITNHGIFIPLCSVLDWPLRQGMMRFASFSVSRLLTSPACLPRQSHHITSHRPLFRTSITSASLFHPAGPLDYLLLAFFPSWPPPPSLSVFVHARHCTLYLSAWVFDNHTSLSTHVSFDRASARERRTAGPGAISSRPAMRRGFVVVVVVIVLDLLEREREIEVEIG